MRILGGTEKGRKIIFKKSFFKKGSNELRPTSAKVRKAIFDIIGEDIIDSVFLDLYAGTGAVGLEALSRKAKEVIFVDNSLNRVKIIREILERYRLKERALVIKDVARNFLKKTEMIFDIIFLDPPYDSNELEVVLPIISGSDILREKGIVIAEHSSKQQLSSLKGLILKKSYRYGDTSLSVFRKDKV